jgi:UDP-N-acetylmuramoylalanine--D-glutamate ligase
MNSHETSQPFKDKKITLMGLGLLGRGLGDARFFAAQGAELIITDLKTAADLAPSIAALKDFPNITYHLGEHHLEDFENRDLIIRAPNAPLDSPFLAHARERGIPIEMDSSLFAKLCGERSLAPIVGITGTRGKTTVTHLIFDIAKAAAAATTKVSGETQTAEKQFTAQHIYLGGNERDVVTLPFIDIVTAQDLVVLELDSWQLQGFAEDKISPQVAVWTNFMPDHMNYYKGDMDRYFEDKAAIARFQKPGDFFIAPREIKEKIETRFGAIAGTWIEPAPLPAEWNMKLLGEHNRVNAALAVAATQALGITNDIIEDVLANFGALPNRLELIAEKNGIAFYNDSNSTTPEATIAALRALQESPETKQRPIVLIAGGSDKELVFQNLARELAGLASGTPAHLKKLILFEGKATEKLKALLPKDVPLAMVSTMDQAVNGAIWAAQSGDIVLLSPGATSFGIFKNEYDRGDQFRTMVLQMKDSNN